MVEAPDENGTPIVIHGSGEMGYMDGTLLTDKIIEHGTMKNGIWIPYTNSKP